MTCNWATAPAVLKVSASELVPAREALDGNVSCWQWIGGRGLSTGSPCFPSDSVIDLRFAFLSTPVRRQELGCVLARKSEIRQANDLAVRLAFARLGLGCPWRLVEAV